jgi:hypothetical protein
LGADFVFHVLRLAFAKGELWTPSRLLTSKLLPQ